LRSRQLCSYSRTSQRFMELEDSLPCSQPRRPGVEPGSGHVGFVVDKVAQGQLFSVYFGFPCQSSFHQFLHNHHHLSFGAGTIGQ
jgi:hypothetical protein